MSITSASRLEPRAPLRLRGVDVDVGPAPEARVRMV